jgi:diaminopimelate epimerase
MISIDFFKYQGSGNDFILIDNRSNDLNHLLTPETIRQWCDRRFGIGADGLMIMSPHESLDFTMLYFNADGYPGSMCGNGGRCMARFAADLGMGHSRFTFMAPDGKHEAVLIEDNKVSLSMMPVMSWEKSGNDWVINTGSPHYVIFTERDTHAQDMVKIGREVRYSPEYEKEGINVNLVRIISPDHIIMRTYERGVEDETLSCGTGVTAAALSTILESGSQPGEFSIRIDTRGGTLNVSGKFEGNSFQDIVLTGPAERVFSGKIDIR